MKTVVVIPIFNGLDDTAACLESLFAMRPEVEVILADDASTDGSAAALTAKFPSIEVVALETNLGFGAASNRGLARAFARGADAVLLANNDTLFTPGLLDRLESTLAETPDAGLVAPLIRAYPGGEIWSAGGICRLEEGSAENLVAAEGEAPYLTDWLTGCAYLMPRKVFDQVGGFDERFFMYGEDVELSLRIREAGYRLIVEPRALLHHRVSQFFSLLSPVKHYYKVRNLLEILDRHLEPSLRSAARRRVRRRAWERLVKDTYRHGWLGVQRFLAVRRAFRDQAAGRLGRVT